MTLLRKKPEPMRRLVLLAAVAVVLAACALVEKMTTPSVGSSAALVCHPYPQIGERGMGGTGVASGDLRTADRGFGGTGIVGVITDFASICVNNVEVAYDPATPVLIDGRSVGAERLRAGQVVAIDSAGERDLRARKVSIIYQVSGRLDAVATGSACTVSGQRVVLADGAKLPDNAPLKTGEWIDVSGLRAQDGTIRATRIDRRAATGPVVVRGVLNGSPGHFRIGDLAVRLPGTANVVSGQWVIAEGHYDHDVLVVSTITLDVVASDPTAFFDPGITRFLIEGYAQSLNGRVISSSGWSASVSLPHDEVPTGGLAVIALERAPGGSVSTTGFREQSAPFGPSDHAPSGGQQQPFSGASPFGGMPDGPAADTGLGGVTPGGFPGGGGPMGGGRPGR
jgi:hypothetical protein